MLRPTIGLLGLLVAQAAPAQREIQLDRPVRDSLSAADPGLYDDAPYHLYTYRAEAGELIRVTLSSRDFAPYLAVGRFVGEYCRAGCQVGGAGEDHTRARLLVALPRAGEYTIRVNPHSGRVTGAYALTLERAEPTGDPAVRGEIGLGATLEGELDEADGVLGRDASYFEDWLFQPDFTGEVEVEMTSGGLPTFLYAGTGGGTAFRELASSGGQGGKPEGGVVEPFDRTVGSMIVSTSRLVLEVQAGGSYIIRANGAWGGATGSYRLAMRRIYPVPAQRSTDW